MDKINIQFADSISLLLFNKELDSKGGDSTLTLYYNWMGVEADPMTEYFNIFAPIQLQSWYFVSVTKQDSIISYYINGNLAGP